MHDADRRGQEDVSVDDSGNSVIGHCWHTARGGVGDTDVTPHWLRTGYRYFLYAALQTNQWWVLRANFCFPAHDFATLFIDGAAVAEVTASADDARPLVSSIGRLSMTHPQRLVELPLMSGELARRVVDTVAPFIYHGSEWGQPCDMCEVADPDPLEPADP